MTTPEGRGSDQDANPVDEQESDEPGLLGGTDPAKATDWERQPKGES